MFVLILLVIGCILSYVLFHKYGEDASDGLTALLVIYTVAVYGTLLGLLLNILIISTETKSFHNEREYAAEMVENLSEDMSLATVEKILDKAEYVNRRIERHKKHVDSKWVGWFYSHSFAKEEPIDIPKLTLKGFNTVRDEI